MYSMRCADGPSVWHLVSIAMSLSVEPGMHRRRDVPHANGSYTEEIRKRTWWTVLSAMLPGVISVMVTQRRSGFESRNIRFEGPSSNM
jgi:hypothetical protein